MAYDRTDRSHWSDDRSDRDFGSRNRDRERGDERGFFERAGDGIRSWLGDEDGRSYGGEGRRRGQRDWPERGSDRGDEGWFGSHGNFGDRGRDDHRERGRSDYGERDRRERESGHRDYRPMAGDYGRSGGNPRDEQRGRSGGGRGGFGEQRGRSDWDRDEYRNTSFAGSAAQSNYRDRHYHEQRQRHMDAFDRDYQDYHRERQSSFEGDFGSWRERRQSKREMLRQVREHMDVVGSDGRHVGTVDRVAGDRIILTRSDPDSGGVHHSLGCTELDRIEGDRLVLESSAEQARDRWRNEDRERALFERDDQGEAGPHMLDRSFSGTYR